MIDIKEVYWAAGIIEGEGCLDWQNVYTKAYQVGKGSGNLRITVQMTDEDIVKRVADIWGRPMFGPYHFKSRIENGASKPVWKTHMTGPGCASWMMMLYPILGIRRRAKIRELLAHWKTRPVMRAYRTHCPKGHEYTEANTKRWRGSRFCRICSVAAVRAYQQREL